VQVVNGGEGGEWHGLVGDGVEREPEVWAVCRPAPLLHAQRLAPARFRERDDLLLARDVQVPHGCAGPVLVALWPAVAADGLGPLGPDLVVVRLLVLGQLLDDVLVVVGMVPHVFERDAGLVTHEVDVVPVRRHHVVDPVVQAHALRVGRHDRHRLAGQRDLATAVQTDLCYTETAEETVLCALFKQPADLQLDHLAVCRQSYTACHRLQVGMLRRDQGLRRVADEVADVDRDVLLDHVDGHLDPSALHPVVLADVLPDQFGTGDAEGSQGLAAVLPRPPESPELDVRTVILGHVGTFPSAAAKQKRPQEGQAPVSRLVLALAVPRGATPRRGAARVVSLLLPVPFLCRVFECDCANPHAGGYDDAPDYLGIEV
jgi:hypothetical protein